MSETTIGTFARYTGLSRKALRVYESAGLLAPAAVDESTGYRRYDRGQVPRARRLAALRDLGVGLADMAQILDATDPEAELRTWWAREEASQAQRRARVERVGRLLAGDARPVVCHELPARTVLAVEIVAPADELGERIGVQLERLRAAAPGVAGLGGVPSVTWLAREDDERLRVELLRVVAQAPTPPPPGATVRAEPPCTLATVALRASELDETAALTALDAIDTWLQEHGASAVGAPRQLWVADARTAAPDEVICLLGLALERELSVRADASAAC